MAPKLEGEAKHGPGRPRLFDRSIALQAALELFWERGFEGTSFDALLAVMGLSASSFYNSFGSKERLYCEAVDSYIAVSGEWFLGSLNAVTDTKTAFQNLLIKAAQAFSCAGRPSGCMISLAGTHVPPSLASVRKMMSGHRMDAQKAMAKRIEKGIVDGDVPAGTDANALAAFFSALSRGLAVQARDGASTDRLVEIVQVAMNVWPASPKVPGLPRRRRASTAGA